MLDRNFFSYLNWFWEYVLARNYSFHGMSNNCSPRIPTLDNVILFYTRLLSAMFLLLYCSCLQLQIGVLFSFGMLLNRDLCSQNWPFISSSYAKIVLLMVQTRKPDFYLKLWTLFWKYFLVTSHVMFQSGFSCVCINRDAKILIDSLCSNLWTDYRGILRGPMQGTFL